MGRPRGALKWIESRSPAGRMALDTLTPEEVEALRGPDFDDTMAATINLADPTVTSAWFVTEAEQRVAMCESQPDPFADRVSEPRVERRAMRPLTLDHGPTAAESLVHLVMRPEGRLAEQYEELAVRITVPLPNSVVPATVLFTGVGAVEGRTTTVAQLAVQLAEGGHGPILAVDADFDRPGLSQALQVDARQGISDVLLGQCGWHAAAHETAVDSLSVMPPGQFPGAGRQMLAEADLAPLMDELRQQYALVLFDGGAATTADTAALAPFCDATYLVVRLHHTDVAAATGAVRALNEAGVQPLGCV